jgi:hypothetical protein
MVRLTGDRKAGLARRLLRLGCARRGTVSLRLLMRHVVADGAANCGTGKAMMASHMACNTADNRTLDATCLCCNRCGKQGGAQCHGAGQTTKMSHLKRHPFGKRAQHALGCRFSAPE